MKKPDRGQILGQVKGKKKNGGPRGGVTVFSKPILKGVGQGVKRKRKSPVQERER